MPLGLAPDSRPGHHKRVDWEARQVLQHTVPHHRQVDRQFADMVVAAATFVADSLHMAVQPPAQGKVQQVAAVVAPRYHQRRSRMPDQRMLSSSCPVLAGNQFRFERTVLPRKPVDRCTVVRQP